MKQLEVVRREQMGPLSAASMESGSYQRGYEYIVRLVPAWSPGPTRGDTSTSLGGCFIVVL
jgi:hypothetical protein